MLYKAAVITMSDKGAAGLRADTAGEAVVSILEENGWEMVYRKLLPDDEELIKQELVRCADEFQLQLVVTTGGTGFSVRDVTPEATLAVIDREVRGIPEAMRAESMKITPMGMLSRAAAGIRKKTLIVNLPGSRKAACECLEAVIVPLRHGIDVMMGETEDCAQLRRERTGTVKAVCISEKRGEQKHETKKVQLLEDYGISGDAHAGKWPRQVSLLAAESVAEVEKKHGCRFKAGAFAENILTEGIELHTLPVGSVLKIGEAEGQVTQIGKECHQGCAVKDLTGDCVMPREGIFIKVIKPGAVKAGDSIYIV